MIFRFDTFGDETFCGGQLRFNEAIASSLTPRTALAFGLKVDVDALPQQLVQRIRRGDIDLDSSTTTLALLRLNAVVGLKGFFDASGNQLTAIGIQCALLSFDSERYAGSWYWKPSRRLGQPRSECRRDRSTLSKSPTCGNPVGRRCRDCAPGPEQLGPGKFDAELFLDGKAFKP